MSEKRTRIGTKETNHRHRSAERLEIVCTRVCAPLFHYLFQQRLHVLVGSCRGRPSCGSASSSSFAANCVAWEGQMKHNERACVKWHS